MKDYSRNTFASRLTRKESGARLLHTYDGIRSEAVQRLPSGSQTEGVDTAWTRCVFHVFVGNAGRTSSPSHCREEALLPTCVMQMPMPFNRSPAGR